MTTDSENQRIMEIERQCTKTMNSIISTTVEEGVSTFASVSSASIEGLVGMGLDQREKQWREQVMAIESNFDSAWSQVQGAVSSLPVSFQYSVKQRLDAYYGTVKSQLAEARSKATEVMDQTAEVVQPDTIRQALSA